jgi:DNA-directed RNA polymerase specialized sigma24 family protein
MTPIDDLAPDQRAVLQLLLKQGKAYTELATLLRISPDAVRDRAVTALDALGPRDGATLAPERRAEIADYLLGQQSASERQATREFLEGSAAGRAWARVVSGELKPLAGDALPEIPAEREEVEEAFDALDARTARRAEVQRSSKVGGAVLLVGAVIVAVALVLIIRGGGNDNKDSASTPSTQASTTTTGTQTQAGQPQIVKQINLKPGEGGKAAGVLFILRQNNQLAFAVRAQSIPPTSRSRFYAVWLTGAGQQPKPLGFAPAVTGKGKTRGRLEFANAFPTGAEKYDTFLITRESANAPKQPGLTVLSGPLSFT